MTWQPGVWEDDRATSGLRLRLRVYVNGLPLLVEVEPAWDRHLGVTPVTPTAWPAAIPGPVRALLSASGQEGAPLSPLRGAIPERPVGASAPTMQPEGT